MIHLSNALTHLQTRLPANWTTFFVGSIPNDDQHNELITSVAILAILDPISNDFFDDLNLSVITGEYISDFSLARTSLDNIEAYLTNLAANFDITGFPNMTLVGQSVLTKGFLKPIRESIRDYRLFINGAERHIKYQPGTDTLFDAVKKDENFEGEIDSAAQNAIRLFQINLEIAQEDHSLSFRKLTFENLLIYEHTLKTLSNPNKVSDILLKKCKYLLYKLTFRLQQKKVVYDYGIDFNYSSVSLIEVPEFTFWNSIVKGHYDKGMNPPSYDSLLKDAQKEFEKQTPTLNLLQYHILTKHFKDTLKDLIKLKKLRDLFNSYYNANVNSSISEFDKKAYEIARCYIENNVLSSELDNKVFDINNWEVNFKKYTDLAESSKNSNFFPYFKIIDKFLNPRLKEYFEASERKFDEIEKLLSKYEDNFKKLTENTGISASTDYLPFQLNFSNSQVDIADNDGILRKCFFASSFVLPLDYKQRKEDHEKYRIDLAKFKTMNDIQQHFQKDRDTIQTMKDDIDKTDKRHIEILSVFAALVMFVSNEIQIFSKITNMADAITYTLFFAYGLGLFVLLIWFITRPAGVKWKSLSSMHFIIVFLFLSGLVYGIYYSHTRKPVRTPEEINLSKLTFKIDSLKKQTIIDSLERSKMMYNNRQMNTNSKKATKTKN